MCMFQYQYPLRTTEMSTLLIGMMQIREEMDDDYEPQSEWGWYLVQNVHVRVGR